MDGQRPNPTLHWTGPVSRKSLPEHLGRAAEFDEALHELDHMEDAVAELRQDLGLPSDPGDSE